MRGEQSARQWKLLEQLELHRSGLRASDLARELNATLRTVYRDLEVLQSVGIPLTTEREGREVRWRLLDHARARVGQELRLSEIAAMIASGALLEALVGDGWSAAMRSGLAKLVSRLPPEQEQRLARFRAALLHEAELTNALRGSSPGAHPALQGPDDLIAFVDAPVNTARRRRRRPATAR